MPQYDGRMQHVLISLAPGVEAARVAAELRALGAASAVIYNEVISADINDDLADALRSGAVGIPGITGISEHTSALPDSAPTEPLLPDPGPGLPAGWSWTEPLTEPSTIRPDETSSEPE